MTWRTRTALVVLLLEGVGCEMPEQTPSAQGPPEAIVPVAGRGVRTLQSKPRSIITQPINWKNSAGIFIGIERFPEGTNALFAADDAIDMTYLFTQELDLPPSRTVLLLVGQPNKPASRKKLDDLKVEMRVIEEGGDDSQTPGKTSVNADTLSFQITEQARKVGPNGILILYIASHGVINNGQHILLTAGASSRGSKGVALAEMLKAIQLERGGRLVLFVDACREQLDQAGWHGSWPELKMPGGGYAVIVAAASGEQAFPGGWAPRNKEVQNGIFTKAVLEGLRCNASIGPDGFLTLGGLNSYVSNRVMELSEGFQQPEFRFGGELGILPFVRCRPSQPVGEILSPKPNAFVQLTGIVEVRASQPELFATVLLCAKSNGVCYNQNLGSSPVSAPPNEVIPVHIQYGNPDSYRIYVVLSADRDFLRGEAEFTSVPHSRIADRIVHWLDPVDVTLTTRPVILSLQEGQHIGILEDKLCSYDPEAPCYKIEAEGYVPEGQAPFFAVEPIQTSPLKWIQPPVLRTKSGSVSSLIYLGEPSVGIHESFKVYLLGCNRADLLNDGDRLAEFPKDCQVSESVKIYRER